MREWDKDRDRDSRVGDVDGDRDRMALPTELVLLRRIKEHF